MNTNEREWEAEGGMTGVSTNTNSRPWAFSSGWLWAAKFRP
jgi:hypothetical protein